MTVGVRKTARGQQIDMDKLKLVNENVSAVGNMHVNARGDILGTGNQIAVGRNAVMDQVYAVASAPSEGGTPKSLAPQRVDTAAEAEAAARLAAEEQKTQSKKK
ncbi:MAG TPA: hypothetical protein VFM18_18400 [Methanosarcina sp.]|nr:hypothetical protein [Methanosarcina sp.]